MMAYGKITDIFCTIDDFCTNFYQTTKLFLLRKPSKRPPIKGSPKQRQSKVEFSNKVTIDAKWLVTMPSSPEEAIG